MGWPVLDRRSCVDREADCEKSRELERAWVKLVR